MAEEKKNGVGFNFGDTQLVNDAGSLSLFTPVGTQDSTFCYGISSRTDGTFDGVIKKRAFPGIMIVDYQSVPGKSTDGSSAINMAAKKLYTYVRHQNSGSRNYDSPDLMMYAYAVGSACAFVYQCERAYGVANYYTAKNRYLAIPMFESLGFDKSILNSLASFRSLINQFVVKLNALKVPKNWGILMRDMAFNSLTLKDGEIDKSQIFALRCTTCWKWNETGTYIGSLTPEYPFGTSGTTKLTLAQVESFLTALIDALVASEDINIMSGDILKAYGDENCLSLGLISDDYALAPIYNRNLLEIVHNVKIYEPSSVFSATDGNIIRQDSQGTIIYDPVVASPSGNYEILYNVASSVYGAPIYAKDVLDFFRDDVKPADVVNAALGTVMLGAEFSDSTKLANLYAGTDVGRFDTFGTMLPVRMRLINIEDGSGNQVTFGSTLGWASGYPIALGIYVDMLSKFDWAPLVRVHSIDVINGDDYWFSNVVGDIYNYTIVNASDLQRIHTLHVLSGFGLV